MSAIGDKTLGWSTAATSNSMATPDGWPEGQSPGSVNDCARAMMAAIRVWYNDAEWIEYGDGDGPYTVTYVSATAFLIGGANVSSVYHVGRRVKLAAPTPGTLYGTITAVSFSTDTTVTVVWDSGSLVNEAISSVKVGILSATNVSFPPATGAVVKVPVRQCVLSAVTSGGVNAAITTGSGLKPALLATASPFVMTFAGGFSGSGVQQDVIEVYSADITDAWTLPANKLSFLMVDRTGPGATTRGSTLAAPQYGVTYDRTHQALLNFQGTVGSTAIPDANGNTWTAQGGAKLVSDQKKFGLTALGGGGTANALNGTSDYIKTPDINLSDRSWAIRGWFWLTALTGAIFGAYGSSFEMFLSSNKLYLYLSSSGSGWDLASGVSGNATLSMGQFYYIELTRDAVAGKYFVYVNGVAESNLTVTNSNNLAAPGTIFVGAAGNGGPSGFLSGYVGAFEIVPFCDHPNGTTYSVPIAPPDITAAGYASDWGPNFQALYKVSAASTTAGTDPTFTAINRLYVAEATTNATTVTNVANYAVQGQYDQTCPTTAVTTVKNHNLGVVPSAVQLTENGVTQTKNLTLGTNTIQWSAAAATSRLSITR